MPFVASGAYGCVFKPYLKCSSQKKEREKNIIGKVFDSNDEFDFELDTIKKIQAIDPLHKFTLPLVGECSTDKTMWVQSNSVDKCHHLQNKSSSSSFKELLIPYGGKSIDYIISKKPIGIQTFNKLIASMIPIIEGIKKLESSSFVHQDIKPNNLLFDGKRTVLIDFGLMMTFDDLKYHTEMMKADYPFFPPEYKLNSNTYVNANEFITDYLMNFTVVMQIAGRQFNIPFEMERHLGLNISDELTILFKKPHFIPQKIDIYMLGMSLFMIYLSTDVKAVSPLIKKIIREMVHPNPYNRLSPENALRGMHGIYVIH